MAILRRVTVLVFAFCVAFGAMPSVAMSVSHYTMQETMQMPEHGSDCDTMPMMDMPEMADDACCEDACHCAASMCSSAPTLALIAAGDIAFVSPIKQVNSFSPELSQSIYYQLKRPPRA